MKHPKLEAEYENLLLQQPSHIRVGAISWIVRIFAGTMGYLFLFLALANLVTGSLTLELLKAMIEDERTLDQLRTEGHQAFIYLVSAFCLLIAVPSLFVAWQSRAIIRRNRHINRLNGFIEKALESHKITEHSVGIIREEIQGKMK